MDANSMTMQTLYESQSESDGTKGIRVVVGIPALNAEKSIATVILGVRSYCDKVIVCDDGSSDDTAGIAAALGCTVVRHERNLGYGSALRSIMDAARKENTDVLVTVDSDGQHNVKEINSLVEPITRYGADIVIGTRFGNVDAKKLVPRARRVGIRSITWLVRNLTKENISDAQCGFRAYGKKALSTIRPGEQGMGASTEILLLAKERGLRIVEVPTTVSYANKQSSTLNPVYHFADVIASTTKVAAVRHPLLLFGLPAVALLGVSLGFGLWALQVFSAEGRLVTNLVLISAGTAIIGTTLLVTAFLLFVIIVVIREKID